MSGLPQLKRNFRSSKTNLVHELPQAKRRTLSIIRNKKILEKAQIRVKTWPSAQSPLQELNFGKSS